MSAATDPHAEEFERYRGLLFAIAYEITASVADADDVLQDSYLRWADVPLQEVVSTRAYLARVVTRQALNAVRSTSRRREEYVGPWLPEPLVITGDIADDVVLADSVSTAMMLVMDALPPVERAVFVLREVFGFAHDDIAVSVGRTPAAVRQIAHRAREHVQARRDVVVGRPPDDQGLRTTALLAAALQAGDIDGLLRVLAPDVVLTTDGGGVRNAARRPLLGADKVARFLLGTAGRSEVPWSFEATAVNGQLGALIRRGEELDTIISLDVVDGQVVAMYAVRNPEKFAGVIPRVLHR